MESVFRGWRATVYTLARFAGHLVAGVVLFCMVGLTALWLEVFTNFLSRAGMNPAAVSVLSVTNSCLLYLDIALMTLWVATSSYHAMKDILTLDKS